MGGKWCKRRHLDVRTTLWHWFSPATFPWVPELELASPGLLCLPTATSPTLFLLCSSTSQTLHPCDCSLLPHCSGCWGGVVTIACLNNNKNKQIFAMANRKHSSSLALYSHCCCSQALAGPPPRPSIDRMGSRITSRWWLLVMYFSLVLRWWGLCSSDCPGALAIL